MGYCDWLGHRIRGWGKRPAEGGSEAEGEERDDSRRELRHSTGNTVCSMLYTTRQVRLQTHTCGWGTIPAEGRSETDGGKREQRGRENKVHATSHSADP